MASRRRVIRPSGDKDVVFKRGREGEDVFDDSELIEAWNKQLQRMQEEGEKKPLEFPQEREEKEEDKDVIEFKSDNESSSGSDDDGEDSSTGHRSTSIPLKSDGNVQAPCQHLEPSMPPGLSPDLQNLLRSWYQAGYHMGTYVANSKKN